MPKVRSLCVFGLNQAGLLHCEIRSAATTETYRLYVRPADGRCWCECPCFRYRYNFRQPTIYSGDACKHISSYREFLQRELQDLTSRKND